MGTQISANYDNIETISTADLWTIHSATHRTTKESVRLWVIDNQKLKERYKRKAVRFRYLDLILGSLQQMRKYRHPRILKILEIADKKPEIGFSSEPFDKTVSSQIANLHPMDVAYISYQVAEVLSFLANEARIVHLGLNPTSVLLDDQLSVKLTQFQWSSAINSQGVVTPSQTYDQLFSEFSDNYIKAPEMLKKNSITPLTSAADVFIFGLFVYEAFTGHKFYDSDDPDTILSTLSTKYSQIKGESKIPADFLPLLNLCLNPDPSKRPTISEVLQDRAFQSMQLKSLRYIDIMLTKNPSDKFAFYKGLSKKVDEFSPSIQRIKLLPTLVNECIADVRFAPILLGAIFQISFKFTTEDFMNLVWRKLSVLATVVNPPEVSIALLRNLWMLLEKVDKRLHKDFVYPIIFSALNSNEPRIHNEVLQRIDVVIDEMNEDTLRSLIMPRLFDLAFNSSNISVSSSSILCISKGLKRMDNETFCTEFTPKFLQIWRKFASPTIALPILNVFTNLNVSLDVLMFRVLPVACEMASSNTFDSELRAKFCNFIIRVTQDFRDKGGNERNFNDQENVQGAESDSKADNDNPFASSSSRRVQSSAPPSNAAAKNTSSISSVTEVSSNPFAEPVEDSPFSSKSSSSATPTSSANAAESTKSSSAFANFDSMNPFASSSTKDDEDEDEDAFGKRKNSFGFGSNNANESSNANNSGNAFGHTENNSASRSPFGSSDASSGSSGNPFALPENNSAPKSPFGSGDGANASTGNPFARNESPTRNVFGGDSNPFENNNSCKDIFSGSSNSGLNWKKSDDFDADSVFSKREASQTKKTSSQPFTEDIFNDKAFKESADDIFGTASSNKGNSNFPSSKTASTSVFSSQQSASPSPFANQSSSSSAQPSTSVFSNQPTSTSTSVFSNQQQSTSTSVFSSQPASTSTSVFSNQQQSTSTSVFSNQPTSTSTSVFSSQPASTSVFSNSSTSAFSNNSQNIGMDPISANDIFGSSVTQSTSMDSYINSAFGSQPSTPPSSVLTPSSPPSNADSVLTATQNQFSSGGFGDFGFGTNSSQPSNLMHKTGSAGTIPGSFGGTEDSGIRVGGFGGNFSSPPSLSGMPNTSPKQNFNPFQENRQSSAANSGIPQMPAAHHSSGGFNPFQSENGGGGGTQSTDGMPRAGNANIFGNPPRPHRSPSNGNFQTGNQPPSAVPRKNPPHSPSYDILDIF